MRRLLPVALAALLFASCKNCGEAPKSFESSKVTVDAGSVGYVATDLKSAIVMTVPEWRGTSGLFAVAVLEETLLDDPSDGGDLALALAPNFAPRRWNPASSDAGALIAENKPFFAEAEHKDGHPVVRVGMFIPGEKFADILQSPAPFTTEQLATLLPVPRGTRFLKDTFVFEVHYKASEVNGAKLLRQLTDGLLKSGWSAAEAPNALYTADAGPLPDEFTAVLKDATRGGSMTLGRQGEHVVVTWEQPLIQKKH